MTCVCAWMSAETQEKRCIDFDDIVVIIEGELGNSDSEQEKCDPVLQKLLHDDEFFTLMKLKYL